MKLICGGVFLGLLTGNSAIEAPQVDSKAAKCSGSADPSITGAVCYGATTGAMGLKETVTAKIDNFAAGKGIMDLTGSGITGINCKQHSFSKKGQAITTDLSDCLPNNVQVEKVSYCSDQDSIQVKVKDTKVPFPITATLPRIDCSALELQTTWTSCTGSKDPTITEPVCYEGAAGALGVKESIDVKVESFASGKGSLDLTGKGIRTISCAKHSFTKSGQAITVDLSDCLTKAITVEGVKYCSDQDTIQVTVKDTKVPFPITATLKKTTCSSTEDVVVV
jgi:hypothetical protein